MNSEQERIYNLGFRDGLCDEQDDDLKDNPWYRQGFSDGHNVYEQINREQGQDDE
jgi:hypothetical protein